MGSWKTLNAPAKRAVSVIVVRVKRRNYFAPVFANVQVAAMKKEMKMNCPIVRMAQEVKRTSRMNDMLFQRGRLLM